MKSAGVCPVIAFNLENSLVREMFICTASMSTLNSPLSISFPTISITWSMNFLSITLSVSICALSCGSLLNSLAG